MGRSKVRSCGAWTLTLAVSWLVVFSLVAAEPAGAEPGTCDVYAPEAKQVGVEPKELPEDSGMATSRKHPEIFWAHNDSGNPFEIFAQRIDGSIAARYSLTGGENVDIEDVAVGPCLEDRKQSCVYLADIGDNPQKRKEVAIYEIVEPDKLEPSRPLPARKLRFAYPDGPHNAEALLVDPHTADLYVITKEPVSLGKLYKLEGLAPDKLGYAVGLVHPAPAPGYNGLTTAADVHPSGTRVILRTYTTVLEYRGAPGEPIEKILAERPFVVTGAQQRQGEAVTYTADGRGYVLGSEFVGSPIFRVDCAK